MGAWVDVKLRALFLPWMSELYSLFRLLFVGCLLQWSADCFASFRYFPSLSSVSLVVCLILVMNMHMIFLAKSLTSIHHLESAHTDDPLSLRLY